MYILLITLIFAVLLFTIYLFRYNVVKYLAKNQLKEKDDLIEKLFKRRNELYIDNQDLKKQIAENKKKREFINYILGRSRYCFLQQTCNNELVIIVCYDLNPNMFTLHSIPSNHFKDSLVNLETKHFFSENNITKELMKELTILDIITERGSERRGYARTLLEFVIQYAKDNNFNRITGELSSVDQDEFEWLIPFYKSIGFEITMRDKYNGKMIMYI